MNRIRFDLEVFARWFGGDMTSAAAQLAVCDDALTRFFRGKAGPTDGDDLKQDVWRRLFERPPDTLQHGPRAYLFGIARHVLYRYYQQKRGEHWDPLTTSICDLDPRLAVKAPHEVGDWAPRSVLQRLPIDDQVLLEMRYEHDLSHVELAEANEIPIGTVKSRLHNARKRLKALLQEHAL